MKPQILPPNVLPRFWAGGARPVAFASGWSGVLEGDVEALWARPADPPAGEGRW